jgi:hypothetical protein
VALADRPLVHVAAHIRARVDERREHLAAARERLLPHRHGAPMS